VSKKKRQRQGRASIKRNQPSSIVIPVIVGVVVVAIVIGAILAIESGRSTPSASAGELAQGNTVAPLDTSALPYPDVPRIALDETQEKIAQGQAILVDVRSKESFDKAHAVGAISIPEEEIDARLNELPRDKELILYCT
jgi:3-mercaptopyruvate sulfurtransferase SseA